MKNHPMPAARHVPLFALIGVLLAWISATASAALIPSPPQVEASGYILMDAASGRILVEHNAHEPLPPASLTKIMTDYIVARELHNNNLSLDEEVTISVKAWRMGGSKMFVREGTRVRVEDLLRGLIIQSGNDATVALAEHIAGGEDAFAEMMNQQASRLGLKNSYFVNATGWPDERQVTSAYDMAVLTHALIRDFPDNYLMYREKSFTYNNITQQNRNLLLWRDPSVDGVKTGHTDAAGYCLVASAERDGMRLISVVMGTSSEQARARESQKLLNYGFRFFENYRAYEAGETLTDARVWMGRQAQVALGLDNALVMTIPRGSHDQLSAEMTLNKDITAPISQGQQLGTVTISLDGEAVLQEPLVALTAVEQAGFFKRLWHSLVRFFSNLF